MPSGRPTRIAIAGCGFWAQFQSAAWLELPGVRVAAVCDRDPQKAAALARRLGVTAVYDDPDAMLAAERPDVLDVITDPATHAELAHLAARHRVPVICQKPLATTLAEAEAMVGACAAAGVPLMVHENW